MEISQFGAGSGHIWLDEVSCEGGEDSVFDCEYLLDTSYCYHNEDVGVRCYGIRGKQHCISMTSYLCDLPYHFKAVCDNGEIRLVNGDDNTEGRLEVCYNGQWGTVCSDEFGYVDGGVVCRQLGFKGNCSIVLLLITIYRLALLFLDSLVIYLGAYFSAGVGDIWLDDVECIGTENSIFECKILLDNHNCLHTQDVGLKCTNETRISMQT